MGNYSSGTSISGPASGTIIDDDSAQFSINGVSSQNQGQQFVIEGAPLSFTVTRSGKTTHAVSVSYGTSEGTATSGSDFTASSGVLYFVENQTTATITVPTIDDAEYEPFSSESMWVTLSNPQGGANLLNSMAVGYIKDNDIEPATLSITSAPSRTEGQSLIFEITRSGTTTTAVSATYTVAGEPGTAGGNFTPTTGTVPFAANQTSQTITVPTINDGTVQGTSRIIATLSNPSVGAVLSTSWYKASGTLWDNDTSSTTMVIGNASVIEGGTLSFTVTRIADVLTRSHSASFTTTGGTATSGSDFTAQLGTVTFAPYQTIQTITVPTTDDAADETTETLSVTLSNPSAGITIATATGTGTINDNDLELGTIIPIAYTASSSTTAAYTGLSGTGAGMRDGIYSTSNSIHGTDFSSQSWIMMDLGSSKPVGIVKVVPASVADSSFAPNGWGAHT